jgi:hypothetical protein
MDIAVLKSKSLFILGKIRFVIKNRAKISPETPVRQPVIYGKKYRWADFILREKWNAEEYSESDRKTF